MDDLVADFVEGVVLAAPSFIALAVGVVVSLRAGPRYPAAALRALVGFGWLAGVYLLAIGWTTVVVPLQFPDDIQLAGKLGYLALSVLEAIGFLILLSAVFAGRLSWRQRLYMDDPPDDDDGRPDPPSP